jgi:hypothetical protein
LNQDVSEAFKSPSWLQVSLETVQTVLKSDDINAEEPELLNALINWGRAYFLRTEGSEPNIKQLRVTIDPCLKLIRFGAMDPKDFATLAESNSVLTVGEKYKILLGLVLGRGTSCKARERGVGGLQFDCVVDLPPEEHVLATFTNIPLRIRFRITKSALLAGIVVEDENYSKNCEFSITTTIKPIQSYPLTFKKLQSIGGRTIAPLSVLYSLRSCLMYVIQDCNYQRHGLLCNAQRSLESNGSLLLTQKIPSVQGPVRGLVFKNLDAIEAEQEEHSTIVSL